MTSIDSLPFVSTTLFGSCRYPQLRMNHCCRVAIPKYTSIPPVQTFLDGYEIKMEARSEDAPYIYERDTLNNDRWNQRVKMINEAHQCAHLFALSILPVNPNITQTWYYKNSRTYHGEIVRGITQTRHLTPSMGKIKGFIQPFLGYNGHYSPEFDENNLATMSPIILPDDIDEKIENTSLRNIARSFLEDKQSESIGLTLLQPQDFYAPVKYLRFIKADF